ncbi:hypothetical protein QCA50_010121 [Cerrena zonata]|uniref:Uncharacterized protein n=1 Tax=Cerrena zonata TaxID=2478898 RepID=A0AAW0G984_9APHY
MINPQTGAPHTAHTTNKVPFIMTGDPNVFKFKEDKPKEDKTDKDQSAKADEVEEEEGALCDVAPTILALLGLPQPEEMTGRSLLDVVA